MKDNWSNYLIINILVSAYTFRSLGPNSFKILNIIMPLKHQKKIIFVQWFSTLFSRLFLLLFHKIFASFATTEALIYFRIKFEYKNMTVSFFTKYKNAEIKSFRIALPSSTSSTLEIINLSISVTLSSPFPPQMM